MIINFPGPDRYISMEKFVQGKARARKYRNRRIGEFFKEIELSEKQGTGIPKILRELQNNGSPKPIFETDDDRIYLETTILIRAGFEKYVPMSESMSKKMSESLSELERERLGAVIQYLVENEFVNSAVAAKILDVEVKTASRLLAKAEKNNILKSRGRTKSKIYVLAQC